MSLIKGYLILVLGKDFILFIGEYGTISLLIILINLFNSS